MPKDRGADSANLNLACTTVSDNSKNVAFPVNGWGTSLSKSPMFTRAEIEKHVKDSGKKYRSGEHHSLPTGLQKAKAFLADEYLHEIQTRVESQSMRPNCNFQRGGRFKPETFHVGVWRFFLNKQQYGIFTSPCNSNIDVFLNK